MSARVITLESGLWLTIVLQIECPSISPDAFEVTEDMSAATTRLATLAPGLRATGDPVDAGLAALITLAALTPKQVAATLRMFLEEIDRVRSDWTPPPEVRARIEEIEQQAQTKEKH
jgi:hypothetical protein